MDETGPTAAAAGAAAAAVTAAMGRGRGGRRDVAAVRDMAGVAVPTWLRSCGRDGADARGAHGRWWPPIRWA